MEPKSRRELLADLYGHDQDAHFDATQLRQGLAHHMPLALLDKVIAMVEVTGDPAVDLETVTTLLDGALEETACQPPRNETAENARQQAVQNPWTPAHQAVESSDHATLTRLLDGGADVNEVCCGQTLLMHAIDLEGDSALQSGQPIDSALTAILLAYGADPGLVLRGRTARDLAHTYNHDMAIRLLDRFHPHQPASRTTGLTPGGEAGRSTKVGQRNRPAQQA
ncbi:hypothetical protein WDV06_26485 [Streptomyces racemochromogenes]|uniref:Ankyrin repeat domain-containing protein n=1 Tax=Streptomyces racemochromogenes TaxID=67353 RepID=A0ABW7PJM2_9ACTN